MHPPRRVARVAGVVYLLMCILGGVARLAVRDRLYVPGDAATTASNIVANVDSLRMSVVADLVIAMAFVFVGLAFYRLLKHADRSAAGAMMLFATVGAAMILANLVFHHAALLVATGASYATAFGAQGSDALVLLLLDMHHAGDTIAGIFHGLWLLSVGYLAVKSRMFPRLLGVLLVVAGASWIVDTLVRFAAPDLPGVVHVLLTAPQFAELAMVAFLLIKGVTASPLGARLATTQHSTSLATTQHSTSLVTTKAHS